VQRALVVGSGSIAKRHIKNLRYLYPEVEVVCVSASCRGLEPSLVGASTVRDSIEQVLEGPLDLAIVASPAPLHLTNVHQLVSANIPVLVEKPLCHDVAEIEKYDFTKSDCRVGVAYNLRYMPSANMVKNTISDRTLGEVLNVHIECGQYLPDWRPGTDYRRGVSAQKKLGGGALLELSHELDYLLWIFGEISSVSAQVVNTKTLDIDVDDNVNAMLKSKSGFLIHLHLDFLQRTPRRMLRAVCENGNLVWNLLTNTVSIEAENDTNQVLYSDLSYDRNDMYIHQLKDFVAFAKDQSEFKSTIFSATRVMKLIAAIRRSSDMNQWIDVVE